MEQMALAEPIEEDIHAANYYKQCVLESQESRALLE
jgi:hypothetical protein